jgi:hypothetical protein
MSLNNSRRSYDDCFALFDRALEADRGIRVEVDDIRAANYLRMRMHHARSIDRGENRVIHADPGDAMHGKSIYDIFVVRIEDAAPKAWVYIDKVKVEIGRIEAIPADHRIEYESMPARPRIEHASFEAEFAIVEPPKLIESPEKFKRRV